MGRNWQAQRCTGEAGAAHHWALAQLVEREGLHGAQLGLLVLRSVNVRARRAGELLLFVSEEQKQQHAHLDAGDDGRGVPATGTAGTGGNGRIESCGVGSGQRRRQTELGRGAQPSMAAVLLEQRGTSDGEVRKGERARGEGRGKRQQGSPERMGRRGVAACSGEV